MLITSYDYAHKIVEQNSNLKWDGWDIVEYKKSDAAEFNNNGKIVDGQWYATKTFTLTEAGWEVPNKYARP